MLRYIEKWPLGVGVVRRVALHTGTTEEGECCGPPRSAKGYPDWKGATMLKQWVLWIGMIAALVGSIYLGRIATSEGLVGQQPWNETGYGVVAD
jgi:hypothetical protein